MINNELKAENRVLLLSACIYPFTSAESEQSETGTYNYRSVPESSTVVYRLISNGNFVLCLYRHKGG